MGAKYVFNPLTGNLDTTDVVAFNGEVNLGTAAAPSVFFTGDTNTGIYSPGADQVAISTNGQGRLFIKSSGNVGIGTSAPLNTLHIVGPSSTSNTGATVLVDSNAEQAADIGGSIAFRGADGTNQRTYGLIRGGKSAPGVGAFDGYLAFETRLNGQANTTERVRITNEGDVGIGTNAPAAQLHVVTSGAGSIRFADGTRAAELGSTGTVCYAGSITSGQDFALYSANAERARLDGSGRMLVGLSTLASGGDASAEAARFVVQGRVGSDNDSGRINIQRGSVPSFAGVDIGNIFFTDSSNNVYAGIAVECDGTTGAGDHPGRLAFSTTADGASSPTEQLRITSDRYVRLASGTGGIQFNGDTAAANALDDYEEGTWTPVHSDAANTTATLAGLYRKIGNLVYIRVTATGTGTLKVGSVSGLPFTNIATIVGTGGKVNHITSATSDTSVIGYQANAAVINLNLSADVSVSVSASWVASITCVTF